MNKKQKAIYERAKNVKNKEELKKVLKEEEAKKKKESMPKLNMKMIYIISGSLLAVVLFFIFIFPRFTATSSQDASNPEKLIAKIETNKGIIEAELDYKNAKSAVDNFKQNVEKGIYTSSYFNQIIPGSFIRGGVPMGESRTGMGANDTIPIYNTGIKHEKYAIGFPQHGTNTNKTQFYILLSDQLQLDNEQPKDNLFGKITKGTEIVDMLAKTKLVAQGKNDFGLDEKEPSRPASEDEVRIKKITIEQ